MELWNKKLKRNLNCDFFSVELEDLYKNISECNEGVSFVPQTIPYGCLTYFQEVYFISSLMIVSRLQ